MITEPAMRWLTRLMSLPPMPSVNAWSLEKTSEDGRRVCAAPAGILPESPETRELFRWLVRETRSVRGDGAWSESIVSRVRGLKAEDLTSSPAGTCGGRH